MNASHFQEERSNIHFLWLIRLRWIAFLGQLMTIVVSSYYFELDLPIYKLLTLVGFSALSNAVAIQVSKKIHPVVFMNWVLLLDVFLLTMLLFYSGGPMNPFSSLYLVHIVLALIILQGSWAWVVTAFSLVCFGLLFYAHKDIANFHEHHDMAAHLQGMWVALGVTSVIIVYFIRHILSSVRQLEGEVEQGRESLRKREQLHSLGTLAAGAAHELSTPLSTIALISKELERKLSTLDERTQKDIQMIRKEVDRCKKILMNMSAYGGQQPGEQLRSIALGEFVSQFMELSPDRIEISVLESERNISIRIPLQAMRICLQNLVQNALDASQDNVSLRAKVIDDQAHFFVQDEGHGMSPDVMKKIGEPFFTTKEPGRGMGLGVFIARSIVEQVGGHIDFHSRENHGTLVTVKIPIIAKEGS